MRGRRRRLRLRLCRRTRIGEKQAGLFTFAPLSAQFFDKQDSVIFSYIQLAKHTDEFTHSAIYSPDSIFLSAWEQ